MQSTKTYDIAKTAIKLHDLVDEVSRSLRFIDDKIEIYGYNEVKSIHCIIFKYAIEEKEHKPFDDEIEMEKKINECSLFDGKYKRLNIIDVEGKVVALTRDYGLIELDVIGFRLIPSIFPNDVQVILKDPTKRDATFISEKYQDSYDLLLEDVKRRIQTSIVLKPKKVNLIRLINYIDYIEGRTKENKVMPTKE